VNERGGLRRLGRAVGRAATERARLAVPALSGTLQPPLEGAGDAGDMAHPSLG